MRLYVCAYDIPEDKKGAKRRRKLVKILEGYGKRVQYSVFELRINDSQQYEELKLKILWTISSKEDSVRIYPIPSGQEEYVEIFGLGEIYTVEDVIVI